FANKVFGLDSLSGILYYPTNEPILSKLYQLLCFTYGLFLLYVLPYHDFPYRQAQEEQTLLLRRRQRPRSGPSAHRPPNLSGQCRKGRRPAQGAHPAPPGLRLPPQQSGVFALLQSLWGQPRSGPSPAHYLLLAAMHRIGSPGPKTDVAAWYRQTILSS